MDKLKDLISTRSSEIIIVLLLIIIVILVIIVIGSDKETFSVLTGSDKHVYIKDIKNNKYLAPISDSDNTCSFSDTPYEFILHQDKDNKDEFIIESVTKPGFRLNSLGGATTNAQDLGIYSNSKDNPDVNEVFRLVKGDNDKNFMLLNVAQTQAAGIDYYVIYENNKYRCNKTGSPDGTRITDPLQFQFEKVEKSTDGADAVVNTVSTDDIKKFALKYGSKYLQSDKKLSDTESKIFYLETNTNKTNSTYENKLMCNDSELYPGNTFTVKDNKLISKLSLKLDDRYIQGNRKKHGAGHETAIYGNNEALPVMKLKSGVKNTLYTPMSELIILY